MVVRSVRDCAAVRPAALKALHRRLGWGNRPKAARAARGPTTPREKDYFAASGKAGSFFTSRASSWMIRVAFRFLAQVTYGVSAELQRLLEQHDGLSRSVPTRANSVLIEHDVNRSSHGTNGGDRGGGELHWGGTRHDGQSRSIPLRTNDTEVGDTRSLPARNG